MSVKQSLIQLSAYDPRILLPEEAPQARFVQKGADSAKGRSKTAGSLGQKKQEILVKFHASEDPKERMRLLDEAMKV